MYCLADENTQLKCRFDYRVANLLRSFGFRRFWLRWTKCFRDPSVSEEWENGAANIRAKTDGRRAKGEHASDDPDVDQAGDRRRPTSELPCRSKAPSLAVQKFHQRLPSNWKSGLSPGLTQMYPVSASVVFAPLFTGSAVLSHR